MTDNNYKEIKILTSYYKEIEKIVAQSSQFQSVSGYVNYVLKEMLFGEIDSGYSKEDEEVVKKRLQDLGYM